MKNPESTNPIRPSYFEELAREHTRRALLALLGGLFSLLTILLGVILVMTSSPESRYYIPEAHAGEEYEIRSEVGE